MQSTTRDMSKNNMCCCDTFLGEGSNVEAHRDVGEIHERHDVVQKRRGFSLKEDGSYNAPTMFEARGGPQTQGKNWRIINESGVPANPEASFRKDLFTHQDIRESRKYRREFSFCEVIWEVLVH